jgi:hypothetical protein
MSKAMLYRWPEAARVGRVVPKTKFYEHAPVTSALKERFAREVQRITWAFKLADETINIPGDKTVPEIQVFVLEAKGDDVSDAVLSAIDKAVKSPIVFEIHRGDAATGEVRMTAVLGTFHSTPWLTAGAARAALPPAVTLAGLHLQLLGPVLPVTPRVGEIMSDLAARVGQVRRLERQVDSLEKRLKAEPQFNRKVDLRRELRATRDMLAGLGAT